MSNDSKPLWKRSNCLVHFWPVPGLGWRRFFQGSKQLRKSAKSWPIHPLHSMILNVTHWNQLNQPWSSQVLIFYMPLEPWITPLSHPIWFLVGQNLHFSVEKKKQKRNNKKQCLRNRNKRRIAICLFLFFSFCIFCGVFFRFCVVFVFF